jgi:DNA-binding NarL/FixJ family response regulator
MRRPRLLLADDHALVLEGLQRLLEPEFELAGAVEDGRALLAAARRLQPDVILLDISMPLLNGIDAARQLRTIAPRAKIIFVTMHADAVYAAEAVRAGAAGYVVKRAAASELVNAIREVLRGRTYITPLAAEGYPKPRPRGELSARQREVLQLVAEGRTNKQVAALLHISVKTVEFHKSSLMKRVGIHSVAELTQLAIKHGLIAA